MKKLLLLVSVLLFSCNLFPQVTLTSPNGGEIWLAGSTQTISWTDINTSGFVNLDYSSDNGVTWNKIVSSASSMYPNYLWWTPTIAATTYKVRVTDVNNSLFSDESDSPFTITDQLPATITLTYPNGGEIIYNGSQQNITWTSSNVGSVNLYFSPDSGLTWNSIASNIPAYMGSYPSTVYSSSTTKALVRISDALNSATFDESDGVFTILDTTKHKITISSPNGGENWQVGSNQYLAWTNTNMTGTVNIDYSTDNGITWLSVATNLPSMYPTFMWTIPNTPSTTCKIKVYDAADQSIVDESDAPFTITTSQNGGVVAHYKFNGDAIDATGNGHDGTVNGAMLVPDRFANPSSAYLFTDNTSIKVPHSPQLNFKGQFTFAVWMNQGVGQSAFNCILGKDYTQEFGFGTWGSNGQTPTYPRLIVGNVETNTNNLSPINCNSWTHLAVTFNDTTDQVQFYINGLLTETATNTGSITATLTDMGIGQDGKYLDQFVGSLDDIRIFDHVLTSPEILAIFNDSGNLNNVLKVDYPNGGEYLVSGTVDTIRWSSNYLTQVKLEYSTNYGDTWTTIVGSMPAQYPIGYPWVVPNTPSTICKVRVTDINDSTMVDESDNVFTINSGNGIDSILYGGKIYHIVKIGTQTWLKENLDIGTMVPGTQDQTNNSLIEKYCYNDLPANCDTYGAMYQWNEAMQYLTTPGTLGICPPGWHIPTQTEFQMLATAVNNDGNALKEVGQGTGGGVGTNTSGFSALLTGFRNGNTFPYLGDITYFWSSTEYNATSAYRMYLWSSDSYIYLSNNSHDNGFSVRCIKDESITNFIQVASPNGGEYFTSGTVDTIRWSTTSTTQVKIDYTTDNGATWMNIAGGLYSIYPAYVWVVPFTPSTTCKVRVTDNNNPNNFDESDSVFTIQPFKSGEYQPDANTVLLDHFNNTTPATILAYNQTGQPCGSELPSTTPNYFWNQGLNELSQALTLNPPIDALPGSGTYLKYPGGQLLSQSNGTIEFWVHLTSYAKGLGLIEQGQFFGACAGWTFNMHVDSIGTLNAGAWAAFNLTSGNTKIPLNRWTHVAASWGSIGAKLYIDGLIVGSDANTGMPANGYGGNLLIPLGTGAGVSASIDELRVSNIQRTEFHIISQKFISVLSPNGGEVFQPNSPVPIEWIATNINNFKLEYTSDNGASWSLICDTLTAVSTGFLWYTPYIESDMVRVRISDKYNPALFDESDSNFTVTNKITQHVPLYYSGWNMISFYVQPLSSLPRDVFPTPLVLQVKTELQSFDPALPEFLNTLKSVNAAQGYLAKTDSAERSFAVKGDPFYPADGINYRAGWNLMSYYYSYGESILYAFEPIMTSVEEVKTLTGYFNPLGSPETNTLYSLEPGEAYWLRLKNNIDGYVLPSPQIIGPKKHKTIGQKLMVDLPWKLKGYPQSTVAIFTVTSDGKPVSVGSVVAAFVNNECRAISEVKLNTEGTAFATLVINGDKEEEVSFKIFDAVKKEAFGSNLKMKTKPGTTVPGIQELPFTFVTGIEDPILPTTTTLMNAYPNPFNPETRIRYTLNKDQHVSLKIYDVLGKEVITLVDDNKNAGYYEVSFDASGLPSGIYFYRMQSGEYVSVKKLLLLK